MAEVKAKNLWGTLKSHSYRLHEMTDQKRSSGLRNYGKIYTYASEIKLFQEHKSSIQEHKSKRLHRQNDNNSVTAQLVTT